MKRRISDIDIITRRGISVGVIALWVAGLCGCEKPQQSSKSRTPSSPVETVETAVQPASTPVEKEGETSAKEGKTSGSSAATASVAPDTLAFGFKKKEEGSLSLVHDGKTHSVIVIDGFADASIRDAVDYFSGIVKKATGAQIPTISPDEERELDSSVIRIFVGSSPQALSVGLNSKALPPETYRIVTYENAVFIVADDKEPRENKANPGVVSKPTLWALSELLEKGLGVRWLWPGDLGTYVPKTPEFAIQAMDLTYQPRLEERTLRLLLSKKRKFASRNNGVDEKLRAEATRWAEVHQNGGRGEISFGHNFGHWWDKYSKEHPDYFAELPEGFTQPFPKAGSVKLRLSNPKVIDQIVEEYKEAGSPNYWNVCPNDGSGFDVSKETRAWDIPRNQDIHQILTAKGNLTARYVKFWNLLYERLKEVNPDVTLVTYAYSSYRFPPPPERPLKAKAVIQFVDGVEAFKNWEEWAKQGVDIYLRPNWWHQGADAPYLMLSQTARYIKFAFENRMRGLDMDSVLGYWGTQGPNYYLVARLMTKPELTKEEIVAEYTSAFGKGAPKIKEYIAYWERLTDRYFYPINAGDVARPTSEFQKLVSAKKVPGSILNGSKYALPFLYNEGVLRPAERFLDDAERLIGREDGESLQRVAFLRKGLDSLRATREQIILGQELKRSPSKKNVKRLVDGDHKLGELREAFSLEHVMWGESTRAYEERYKILMRETSLEFNEINLDGM